MKKLIIILSFLIVTLNCFSQNVQSNNSFIFQPTTNSTTSIWFKNGIGKIDSGWRVPIDNRVWTPTGSGWIRFNPTIGALQYYNADSVKWLLFGSGSGGLPPSLATLSPGFGLIGVTYDPYSTNQTWLVDTSQLLTINNFLTNYFDTSSSTTATFFNVVSINNTPPVSPLDSSYYLVGTAPTGIWITHENQVAQRLGTGWAYTTPEISQTLTDISTQTIYIWNGTAWIPQKFAILGQLNPQDVDLRVGSIPNKALNFYTDSTLRMGIAADGGISFPAFNDLSTDYTVQFVLKNNLLDTVHARNLVAVSPLSLSNDTLYCVGCTGGGGSLLLQTNGVDNGDQTKLNLVAGTNVTLADNGTGNVTINASGGSGSVDYVKSGVGILVDSTGRNYTVNVDTNLISTRAWRQKGIDSVVSLIPSVTPAALTKTDDANVTLTLGGTPATALLQAASLTLGWTGTLAATRGGTGTGTVATGDLLYGSGTNAWSKLSIGSTGQHLVIVGGLPVWRDTTAATGGTVTNVTGSGNIASSGGTTPNITFTGVLPIANGGTNNGSLSVTNGNLLYTDGSKVVGLGVGTAKQHLLGGTIPHWADTSAGGSSSTVFDSLTWTPAYHWNILPSNTAAQNDTGFVHAMNYLISKGGGTLYFQYLDSAIKCNFIIPGIVGGAGVSIRLLGANPYYGYLGTIGTGTIPQKGSILKNTDSTTNAVLTVGAYSGDFSSINLWVQNMCFETYNKTKISGVDAYYAQQFVISDCFINTNTYSPQCALPQSTSSGIITPHQFNGGITVINNTAISGYYNGIVAYEHTSGHGNEIVACYNGINFPISSHNIVFVSPGLQRNHYNFYCSAASSNPNITIIGADIEHAGSDQFVDSTAWQQTAYDIWDSLNLLQGSVTYSSLVGGSAGGAGRTYITKNGGNQVSVGAKGFANYVAGVPFSVVTDSLPQFTAATTNNSIAPYIQVNNSRTHYIRMGTIAADSTYANFATDALRMRFDISGAERFTVNSIGAGVNNSTNNNRFSVGTPATADGNAAAIITSDASRPKGLVIQGFASQSTNSLIETQTSAGLILDKFSNPQANTHWLEIFPTGANLETGIALHDNSGTNGNYAGIFLSGSSIGTAYMGAPGNTFYVYSNNNSGTWKPMVFGGYSGGWNEWMRIATTGKIGIGVASPAAWLQVKAGTTTAAPFALTSGTNLTTAAAGSMEYDGTNLFFTPTGTIRKTIPTNVTGRSTAQTAAVATVVTQTVGAADASYYVSANVLVTTSSAENFTVTVAYTDEGNTARTLTLNFQTIAGVLGTAIAFANGAVPYEGVVTHIRCKAASTITIKTAAGGTYTGCTYNVEGNIVQTN